MKALRKLGEGKGNLRIQDVPSPSPGPGEILLRVGAAGVCGTDLHIWEDQFAKVRPPVTLGHEFAGEVIGLGPEVEAPPTGSRVTVETEAYSCGDCAPCRTGQTNLCQKRLAYGYSTDGGFTEYAVVRASAAHELPGHVSLQQGALGEPLAVGVHAVMQVAKVKEGEFCLVTGAGTIGIICALVAKAAGATVVLSGLASDKERLDAAAAAGLENLVMCDQEDLVDIVTDLSRGDMVDVALECSGAPPAVSDCLALLKPQARLIQVGLFENAVALDLNTVALKELRIWGSFAHNPESWNTAIRLWEEKKVDLTPLVSGVYQLHDWLEPFELSSKGRGVKYLLRA